MRPILDAATAEVIRRVAPSLAEQAPAGETNMRWHPGAVIIRQVCQALADAPGEWYPPEAISLAVIVIEELGVVPALTTVNEHYPADKASDLFREYRRSYEYGAVDECPDPVDYLQRAARFGAVEQARFGGMLEVYLEYAPVRPVPENPAARARIMNLISESYDEMQKRRDMGFTDEDVV